MSQVAVVGSATSGSVLHFRPDVCHHHSNMKLITLPLEIRRRLLEHEPDTLTPLVEAKNKKAALPCPRCGGAMHQFLAERPFTSTSILPRTVARCVDCSCEMDMQSGLMVKMGNPAQVEDPFPIIKPKDD